MKNLLALLVLCVVLVGCGGGPQPSAEVKADPAGGTSKDLPSETGQ